MKKKEPGMLRHILIAAAVVFGGGVVAMYVHEKSKPAVVIREAQMAPPSEITRVEPQAPEPKREPARNSRQVIKEIDQLAGRIDGMLKASPKFKGR